MPDKKRESQQDSEEQREADEGASILEKDQTSFVDEKSPRGKQFGEGRKVADLDRVGAVTPDADADEPSRRT
jgi:hypothetical protein